MTELSETLASHRELWAKKPCLRLIYQALYRRMVAHCVSGRTLEVGGGIGNLKEYLPSVITTDIQAASWLDLVADAQSMPFADGSFHNVVMMDVLHHLPWPSHFFAEAERILAPGGRIVLMEPGISPVSHLFYKMFHQEPVRMSADPLGDQPQCSGDNPYDANQAVPTLLFTRHLGKFKQRFPRLKLIVCFRPSVLAYPLSGGFKSWTLLPGPLAKIALALDDALAPMLGRLMGFRLFVVLEKI